MSKDDVWDECFYFGEMANPESFASGRPNKVLLGVVASPDQEENWDDFFEFDQGGTGDLDEVNRSGSTEIENSGYVAMPPSSGPQDGDDSPSNKLFFALKVILSRLHELRSKPLPSGGNHFESKYLLGAQVATDFDPGEDWRARIEELEGQVTDFNASGDKISSMNAMWRLAIDCKCGRTALEAMDYFFKIFELYQALNMAGGASSTHQSELEFTLSKLHFQMGITACILQDLVQAEISFQLALDAAVLDDDVELLIGSYLGMGSCLFKLGRFLNALDFYQSFLYALLDMQINVEFWLPSLPQVFCDVGVSALQFSQFSLAHEYFEAALQFNAMMGDEYANAELEGAVRSRILELEGEEGWVSRALSGTSVDGKSTVDDGKGSLTVEGGAGEDLEEEDSSWADLSSSDCNNVRSLRTQLFFNEDQKLEANEISGYRILPERNLGVITVKYPKPSLLYSIRMANGRILMNEVELEAWLGSMVLKHFGLEFCGVHRNWPRLFSRPGGCAVREGDLEGDEGSRKHSRHVHALAFPRSSTTFWEEVVRYFEGYGVKGELDVEDARILIFDCIWMWEVRYDSIWRRILEVFGGISELESLVARVGNVERCVHYGCGGGWVLGELAAIYERVGFCSSYVDGERTATLIKSLVLADVVLYLNDRSMLDMSEQDEDEDEDEEAVPDDVWIHDEELCVELLKVLYLELPEGRIKVKAAYAMGLYFQNALEDVETAERLYFESCVLLDRTEELGRGLILGPLGSTALVSYGRILIITHKYRYAVLALEAGMQIFAWRGDLNAYYKLGRFVAQVSSRRSDYSSLALSLYSEICDAYRRGGRVNEAVYVYEILCNLYVEQCRYERAFEALSRALELFFDHRRVTTGETAAKNVIDPAYCRLAIRSAVVLVQMNFYERALEVLARIARFENPPAYRVCISEWFVRIMLKRRAFSETQAWIETWYDAAQSKELGDYVESQDKINNYRSLRCTKSFVSVEVLYHEFRARNFLNANKLGAALEAIDTAVKLTSPKRHDKLNRLYKIRGDVLNAFNRQTPKFPLKLNTPLKRSYFKRRADLVYECIESYRKAYDHAKSMGDDDHICKFVTQIALLYLDYLFWPVATNELCLKEALSLSYSNDMEPTESLGNEGTGVKCASAHSLSSRNTSPNSSDVSSKRRRRFVHEQQDSARSEGTERRVYGEDLRYVRDGGGLKISVETIENAAKLGLELATELHSLMDLLSGCLNMAELRYLQGKTDLALLFWNLFREQFGQFFLDGTEVLFSSASPSFIHRLLMLVRRGVRLLVFQPRAIVNNNLDLIDILLHLERQYEQRVRESSSLSKQHCHSPSAGGHMGEEGEFGLFSRGSSKFIDVSEGSGRQRTIYPNWDASYIWNLYRYIRSQQRSYGENRITREELHTRCIENLKRILNTASAIRNRRIGDVGGDLRAGIRESTFYEGHGPRNPQDEAPESICDAREASRGGLLYDEIHVQKCGILKGLICVVQLDNHLVYYVPYTGDRRIQKLGRKGEKKFAVSSIHNRIYVSIHLLNKREHYVELLVPLDLTLNCIIKYLFSKESWTLPVSGRRAARKGFTSSALNQPDDVFDSLRVECIETSPLFCEEFSKLLGLIDPDSAVLEPRRVLDLSKLPISLIKFSSDSEPLASCANGGDMQIVLMHGRMHKTIVECFSWQELKNNAGDNPLRLYLYHSSSLKNKPCLFDAVSNTIHFSANFENFLSSLIGPNEKSMNIQDFVLEMQQQFSPLIDILPLGSGTSWMDLVKKQPFKNKIHILSFSETCARISSGDAGDPKEKVNTNTKDHHPLLLVATKSMQAIPWELFLPSVPMLRFLTIGEVYRLLESKSGEKSTGPPISPRFSLINWFYSNNKKAVQKIETHRINSIMLDLCRNFNLSQFESGHHIDFCIDLETPSVGSAISDNSGTVATLRNVVLNRDDSFFFPFSSPTVSNERKIAIYKQRYKHIVFVDLRERLGAPGSIDLGGIEDPVVICSFADLVEMNASLFYLLRNEVGRVFVFVPLVKVKHLTGILNKIMAIIVKAPRARDYVGYERLLLYILNCVSIQYKIPMVILNFSCIENLKVLNL